MRNLNFDKLRKAFYYLAGMAIVLPALFWLNSQNSPTEAAVGFVKEIGTANSKATGTTLVITIPAGGVTAGNSIIVTSASDESCKVVVTSGVVEGYITGITDTSGNTYSLDQRQDNNNGELFELGCAPFNGTHWTEIWSAHNVTSLSQGNTITITYNVNPPARAASAVEFSGLATSSTKDKTASTFGSGVNASSGSTATTVQADELLVGLVGVEGPIEDTFTQGGNYSLLDGSGTTGGNAITNVTANSEYRIVSSTGTYVGDGTLGTSRNWEAVVVTYKAAATNVAPAAPTLAYPADNATGVAPQPLFQLRTTDADNDYLRYKIEVCSTSNCSSVVRTIDQTSSQTGWLGQDLQSGTAYTGNSVLTSSTLAKHSYQIPPLSPNTQYWWRAYAIDPGGTNTFGSASGIFTFTTAEGGAVVIPGGITIQGGTQIH